MKEGGGSELRVMNCFTPRILSSLIITRLSAPVLNDQGFATIEATGVDKLMQTNSPNLNSFLHLKHSVAGLDRQPNSTSTFRKTCNDSVLLCC